MTMAITSLFLLFLVVILGVGLFLGLPLILMILLALGFVLLQWAIGPVIIKWVYKIRWVGLDHYDAETQRYIQDIISSNNIKTPKFGIIDDGNPNAFCFGWTRNSAYLVLTRGISDYCDGDEQRAVIGHEFGHIVHNDFVVMTLVAAVPLLLYVIARTCFEIAKHPSGGKDDPTPLLAIVGAITYVIYLISNFIVMFIARCREYWADQFAAETGRNPQPLITALVKIAYGLAAESKSSTENKKKDKRYENALMIFDSKVARNLAFHASSVRDRQGEVAIQDMKEAMAWDLWNPWAKYFELFMTHPLPAKRIKALDKVGEDMGMAPYLDFDLVQPESYWDEFLQDVFAKYSFIIPIIVGGAIATMDPLGGLGLILAGIGAYVFFYLIYYKYPMGFRKTDLEFLIDDPKASPIRGFPVQVEGRIIGRGNPGLIFNEDLKLDDGRALMLLDYHQVIGLIDFFVGLLKTEKYIDQEDVVIQGWYRRVVTPYIEIYKMKLHDRTRNLYTRPVHSSLAAGLAIFGGVFMLYSPFLFLLIPVLLGLIMLILGYYYLIRWKYEREYPRGEEAVGVEDSEDGVKPSA